jgi:hypothetical protein
MVRERLLYWREMFCICQWCYVNFYKKAKYRKRSGAITVAHNLELQYDG